MKDSSEIIELWRTKPLSKPLRINKKPFSLKHVFPSGRQALSFTLSYASLNRPNRVAYPEWSSHCVVSSLGRYVTPVPMKEVVDKNIEIDAILLYEQWGWPFSETVWQELIKRYKKKMVILDRVDSADFYFRREKRPFKSLIEITSLSKLLGVPGGGLAMHNSKYLVFKPKKKSLLTEMLLEKKGVRCIRNSSGYRNFFQNGNESVSPDVSQWVRENNAEEALREEAELRRNNLFIIGEKGLSRSWPRWMRDALRKGAVPGIVPLMRNRKESELKSTAYIFEKDYGIRPSIYHFNWSGNPIKPLYEKCLAFPVHGMVKDLNVIFNKINNLKTIHGK